MMPGKAYAVIGASTDPDKYGNKVLKDLLRRGLEAIPINPKKGMIEGKAAYASVLDFPGKIDMAVMVVPPDIGMKILPEILSKKIPWVWFQPGSESEGLVLYCQEHGLRYTVNACIMVDYDD